MVLKVFQQCYWKRFNPRTFCDCLKGLNRKDIPYVQDLLGHRSIKTTERYTHIISDAFLTVTSPFDRLVPETGFMSLDNRPPP
jgi:hypothetical protein